MPPEASSIPRYRFRGHSSAGRALAWHARGQRFDPAWLHQSFLSLARSCGTQRVVSARALVFAPRPLSARHVPDTCRRALIPRAACAKYPRDINPRINRPCAFTLPVSPIPQPPPISAPCRNGTSPIFIPLDAPEVKRISPRRRRRPSACRPIPGQARRHGGDGAALAEAIVAYEALSDLMGRLGSYAGLLYAGNQADPARAKFYGDISEKLTAISTDLIFFELELNQIDDAALAKRLEASARSPATSRGSTTCARRSRTSSTRRSRQLFHEKGQTARGAFNRLFNETMTALRFPVDGEAEPLTLEPTLNLLSNPDRAEARGRRRGARQGVQGQRAAVHADHQHAGQGQGDLRPLARLQGRRRQPQPGQQVEARWSMRWCRAVRAAYPRLSHRYYAHEGEVARPGAACTLGPQRAAAREAGARHPVARGASAWCSTAYGAFAPEMAGIARRVLRQPLDRCAGAAGQGARRLRASDRAVGASLCAAELPGQGARRDDAGARAGPWRASGAGAQRRGRCWRRRR